MSPAILTHLDPNVVPRPAAFWRGAKMPRHLPASLADALHKVAVALHDHPGRRIVVDLDGNRATAQQIANLCNRSVASLPHRTALVLAEIDRVKGLRWLDEDRTVAEAARYLRAVVAF